MALGIHAPQDIGPPVAHCFRVCHRVYAGRALRQSAQRGGFSDGEVVQGLAEIGFSSRSDSVGLFAQVNLVQVEGENFLLREFGLEAERQEDFAEFPLEFFFPSNGEHIARQLLRNRAATLR